MREFGIIGWGAVIFTAFVVSVVHAQQKSEKSSNGPEGTWKGTMSVGDQKLRLVTQDRMAHPHEKAVLRLQVGNDPAIFLTRALTRNLGVAG